MWINHLQKDRILYNFGFVQGLTSPLLYKPSVKSNLDWGFFIL